MKQILLSFALLFSSLALADSRLFSELSLPEALAKAKAENKVVLVDFYTTWCPSCVRMDRNVFPDPRVVEWVKKNTVAIKFDADKRLDLSETYKVAGYPTMLFLRPDGSEMGRLLGSMPTELLLKQYDLILKGKDMADELPEAAIKDPTNFGLRMQAIDALTTKDKHLAFEATKQLLVDRHAGLLKYGRLDWAYWGMIGLKTPESEAYVAERRATFKKQILAGNFDQKMLFAFDSLTYSDEELVKLYDTLKAQGKSETELAAFAEPAGRSLRKQNRHAELERLSPVNSRLAAYRKEVNEIEAGSGGPVYAEMENYRLREFYEDLLAQKRFEEADKLGEEILDYQATDRRYNDLAWAAFHLGNVRDKDLAYAKKSYEINDTQDPTPFDTYARCLWFRGKKAEAARILQEGIDKVKDETEKAKLKALLTILKEGGPVPTS